MCTAIVKKGDDLIVGFNFDFDPATFKYKIYARKDMFYIGITVGSTTYKTHGVNRNGNAGDLPYRNGEVGGRLRRGAEFRRLDLLNDRYIAGKLTYAELLETVRTKTLVDVPGMSMHSQFSDAQGHILIAEPGLGWREVEGNYSIITNFPVLRVPDDLSAAWYGADRYRTGLDILQKSGADFSVQDALALLDAVKQEGAWATRVSYVYSANAHAVFYALDGDFSHITEHKFER